VTVGVNNVVAAPLPDIACLEHTRLPLRGISRTDCGDSRLGALTTTATGAAEAIAAPASLPVEHRDPCVVVAEEPRDAESVLTPRRPARYLPEETAARSTITQIYEGTNQIQRMVMARQLLKG
jgi:hypothetical protein